MAGECAVWRGEDGAELVCFTPGLVRLFPADCVELKSEPLAKLRYAVRLIGGYRVYVLRKGGFIGHAVIRKGKSFRYPFLKACDSLLGPYYVDESQRGHGLARVMLTEALRQLEGNGGAVYACVLEDNAASIKTLERLGFGKTAWLNTTGFVKRLSPTETACGVWRKSLEK